VDILAVSPKMFSNSNFDCPNDALWDIGPHLSVSQKEMRPLGNQLEFRNKLALRSVWTNHSKRVPLGI
jgi:hypothetical protein